MDRIMILEDDRCIIDGLSYALNKQGYDVTPAAQFARVRISP